MGNYYMVNCSRRATIKNKRCNNTQPASSAASASPPSSDTGAVNFVVTPSDRPTSPQGREDVPASQRVN